jgi:hypothetical protein
MPVSLGIHPHSVGRVSNPASSIHNTTSSHIYHYHNYNYNISKGCSYHIFTTTTSNNLFTTTSSNELHGQSL